eukprot:scaffold16119_cov83-Skeletonema_marinoi.AAC.5
MMCLVEGIGSAWRMRPVFRSPGQSVYQSYVPSESIAKLFSWLDDLGSKLESTVHIGHHEKLRFTSLPGLA